VITVANIISYVSLSIGQIAHDKLPIRSGFSFSFGLHFFLKVLRYSTMSVICSSVKVVFHSGM